MRRSRMAPALRGVCQGIALVLIAGSAPAEEEPIPFVGPPKPPPPLVLKKYAGDIFGLAPFVLEIPLDDDGDGFSDRVAMPFLRNFEDPDCFRLDRTGNTILFRVRSDDPRMKDESFPRSELREQSKQVDTPAAWSTSDGLVRTLSIAMSFTRLPTEVPVSALSLHGDQGEVLAVRHEGDRKGRVVLSRRELDPVVLAENYETGKTVEILLVLSKGTANLLVESKSLAEWPLEGKGLQFRAGCVLERAPETGAGTRTLAEVSIAKLYLTHKSR
jgi:hypothetical protein